MLLISLPRLFKSEIKRCASILGSTPKVSIVPTANITSKENRDPNIKKPDPWPYETKKFRYWHGFYSSTIKRFDENTKIIVVDGNIGAGKGAFAKALADAFDFRFIPETTLDPFYTTPYGYDLRKLNPIAPPSFKSYELKDFYKNPQQSHQVAKFQFQMYVLRLRDYIAGLAHILNTGQGLVMERSVYSDFVFFETMFKAGYFSKAVKELYYDIQNNTLDDLLRPHLIVYLDISPDEVLKRIKNKNDPNEVNSPVLTKEYVSNIDYMYKQKYLKEAEKHSEILIYDWNNYGDVEVVVEDIEGIDFERFGKYDSKCQDWRKADDWEWSIFRRLYTNHMTKLLKHAVICRPSVAEVHHPAEEVEEWREILHKIPGEKYVEGYNPMAGDNVWFKNSHTYGSKLLRIW